MYYGAADWKVNKLTRFGLRKVQLVQEMIHCIQRDKSCNEMNVGRTFYFKFNQIDMYIKGSNLGPMDYYGSSKKHGDDAELDWLLSSTIAANLNLLRVPGSGLYMSDAFYEKADQMGVLVWQDFMFSGRMYPLSD